MTSTKGHHHCKLWNISCSATCRRGFCYLCETFHFRHCSCPKTYFCTKKKKENLLIFYKSECFVYKTITLHLSAVSIPSGAQGNFCSFDLSIIAFGYLILVFWCAGFSNNAAFMDSWFCHTFFPLICTGNPQH